MATKDGKKTGGRVKGTPNRRNSTVTEHINEKGANPIDALCLVLNKALKDEDWAQISHTASILAPYHSPRLAASKIEGEVSLLTYEQKLALLDK